MKLRIEIIIFFMVLFISSSLLAQWQYFRPDLGPISIQNSDENNIRQIFSVIKNSINNKGIRIDHFLSKSFKLNDNGLNTVLKDDFAVYEIVDNGISIKDDEAVIEFDIINMNDSIPIKEKIALERDGKTWLIKSSTAVIHKIIIKHINNSKNESLVNHFISELNTSNSSLIQRTAWWTSINTINQTVTLSEIEKFLFEKPSDGKVVNLSSTQDCFSVVSDFLWNRILYASHDNQWIKSYGDNAGDRKLWWPDNINLNQYGNIYLLSDKERKIVKLQYNSSQQLINYNGEMSIGNIAILPTSMSVNDNFTSTLSDDIIWIADKADNSLIKLDYNGNLLGKYKRIIDAWTGEIVNLNKPTEVAAFHSYNSLCIIDENGKRFISMYGVYYYQGDAIYGPITTSVFNEDLDVKLISIGRFERGPQSPIMVGDASSPRIHFFGNNKGYLSSTSNINGIDQWEDIQAIVSTNTSWSNEDYLGGMILDNWDENSGINTYYLGADIVSPKTQMEIHINGTPSTHIKCIIPTLSLMTTKLYEDNGTLVRNEMTNTVLGADENELGAFNSGNLPNAIGKYRLNASVLPYYNNYYGSVAMSPVVKDIIFSLPIVANDLNGPSIIKSGVNFNITAQVTSGSGDFIYRWFKKPVGTNDWIPIGTGNITSITTQLGSTSLDFRCNIKDNFSNCVIDIFKTVQLMVAPVITTLTQHPTPVCREATTRFTTTLSQGNGVLTYTWTLNSAPAGSQIYPNGAYCDVYIGPLLLKGPNAPAVTITCKAENDAGNNSMNKSILIDNSCNGCPTLAIEQNGNIIDENPLLISSMSMPDKDVTDYYLINTLLLPINNKINLTIHEPQTEHTWFDHVSLLETRANPDETIVVNDEGQVINYKGVLPARILLNDETDITQNLLELDSLSVGLNPGDKLTISRNAVESDGDVVINGEEGVPISKRIPAMLMNVITQKESVDIDTEIVTESIPFTNFFLRPNKSTISKKLRNLPAGTIEITVNKKLTLDYFVFVSDLRTARTRTLPLLSAIHNTNGEVKNKITGIDQNYTEMYPTERIDLSFSTTTNSGNTAYILKTVGRYEKDTTLLGKQNNLVELNEPPIIPTENKLYDNYPNPFNPSTTIKYSLKDDGKVSLIIFNSLGEEVKTLVDEIKTTGYYEVDFNASKLASGIYFYRIQAGDFVETKKMILMK